MGNRVDSFGLSDDSDILDLPNVGTFKMIILILIALFPPLLNA